MLSGPQLVLIGIGAMVVAFIFCKVVEVFTNNRERDDPPDEPSS